MLYLPSSCLDPIRQTLQSVRLELQDLAKEFQGQDAAYRLKYSSEFTD
jgi:hypothetical protein